VCEKERESALESRSTFFPTYEKNVMRYFAAVCLLRTTAMSVNSYTLARKGSLTHTQKWERDEREWRERERRKGREEKGEKVERGEREGESERIVISV